MPIDDLERSFVNLNVSIHSLRSRSSTPYDDPSGSSDESDFDPSSTINSTPSNASSSLIDRNSPIRLRRRRLFDDLN